MSGHGVLSEPVLMDEEIVRRAVNEQRAQDQTGRVSKAEGVNFTDILKIRLEYKNILMISHLRDFTSLTRLDLNNNLIERIQGLGRLRNLTWLNLSFNRIKKIEGLDCLGKIELLNLTDNRISVIENMDELERLTNFGIANNLLRQMDNVLYLRKFQTLRTLNLYGNPISTEEDYTLFIAAHFPHLMHLDYRLLSEETRNEASFKYRCAIEETRHRELQKLQADQAGKIQEAELQLHADAFVEFLNGPQFFKSMMEDDPEAETLQRVTAVAQLLQTFEEQTVELCLQLFEKGLAEQQQREAEVNSFLDGQTQAVAEYQRRASQLLAEFEQKHKKIILDLQQVSEPDSLQDKIHQHHHQIHQLSDDLMTLEFRLVSQLEDVIKKLEVNICQMVGGFAEFAQGIFAQCRELEDNYHRQVRGVAMATLKNVAVSSRDEDTADEVRALFTDKNRVMAAVTTAHDKHVHKINRRETLLLTRADKWREALIKEIQDKELRRNRACVSDIHNYTDYLREQLEDIYDDVH